MKLLIKEREENSEQLEISIEADVLQLGYLHYEATKEIISAFKERGVTDEMIGFILSQSIDLVNDLGGKQNDRKKQNVRLTNFRTGTSIQKGQRGKGSEQKELHDIRRVVQRF